MVNTGSSAVLNVYKGIIYLTPTELWEALAWLSVGIQVLPVTSRTYKNADVRFFYLSAVIETSTYISSSF